MEWGRVPTYTHANNQGPPQRSPAPVSSNILSNIRSRALKWMGLQLSLDYHTSSSSQDSPRPVEWWEESTLLLHGSLLARGRSLRCRSVPLLLPATSRWPHRSVLPAPPHPSGSHPAPPALPPGGNTNLAVLPFSMPYLHAGIPAGSG